MNWSQVLLIAVLVIPALGAGVVALVPADRTARIIATVFAALTVLPVVGLGFSRPPAGMKVPAGFEAGPWTEVDASWVPALRVSFHLGVDGVSYPLVALTVLLTLLCTAYTIAKVPAGGSGRTLAALLLILEVGILGTFLALDLVLFFVFFEVVLLPMYAVIAGWGGDRRREAARKFVIYTLFGSVLLLLGVFTVVVAAGTGDMVTLAAGTGLSKTVQCTAFVLFAVAFAVKAPLWPLHTWLPDAHTEAPTVGSVILAGVMLKMGTYGLIRIGFGITPRGAAWAAPVLAVLAVAAIIAGALICLRQTELKRLIAYSSVGHMGFVVLGIATLTDVGLQAALLGNIAHGVITGLLFFLAGAIKDRAHTGALADLGGLRETAPRLAGLLAFAAIASLGLPGLAGFWGEAFAVVAAVQRGGAFWFALAALAAVGGALTAAYFLRLLRRVTHGPALPSRRPAFAAASASADSASLGSAGSSSGAAGAAGSAASGAAGSVSSEGSASSGTTGSASPGKASASAQSSGASDSSDAADSLGADASPDDADPTAPHAAGPSRVPAFARIARTEWIAWSPLILLALLLGLVPTLIVGPAAAAVEALTGVVR